MSVKSVWWSVTAFGDEIDLCEGTLPAFVRAIYGGREIAPTTGTLHFQGALQLYEQQRMGKLKSWLKHAHLEPAKAVDALKQYVMKAETAAGEKVIRTNPVVHLTADQMCLRLALAGSLTPKAQTDRQTDGPDDYYRRVRKILADNPELAGQLMNPSLRNFWINTAQVWVDRAIVLQPDPPPASPAGDTEVMCACTWGYLCDECREVTSHMDAEQLTSYMRDKEDKLEVLLKDSIEQYKIEMSGETNDKSQKLTKNKNEEDLWNKMP